MKIMIWINADIVLVQLLGVFRAADHSEELLIWKKSVEVNPEAPRSFTGVQHLPLFLFGFAQDFLLRFRISLERVEWVEIPSFIRSGLHLGESEPPERDVICHEMVASSEPPVESRCFVRIRLSEFRWMLWQFRKRIKKNGQIIWSSSGPIITANFSELGESQ